MKGKNTYPKNCICIVITYTWTPRCNPPMPQSLFSPKDEKETKSNDITKWYFNVPTHN
jgi:hypothetical protein